MAEYSTILNPTPQVAYLTNDHLGSPRINTDENGKVIARHYYRSYGEEVTERTHTQYVADTVRKQFIGYERDGETDLMSKAQSKRPLSCLKVSIMMMTIQSKRWFFRAGNSSESRKARTVWAIALLSCCFSGIFAGCSFTRQREEIDQLSNRASDPSNGESSNSGERCAVPNVADEERIATEEFLLNDSKGIEHKVQAKTIASRTSLTYTPELTSAQRDAGLQEQQVELKWMKGFSVNDRIFAWYIYVRRLGTNNTNTGSGFGLEFRCMDYDGDGKFEYEFPNQRELFIPDWALK